ncbi:MAG TPA: hypothetical protein VLM89_02620 [Phycisphaerae bacterium]|nr:hypothetical protein [Phycisphaerae bacterium]
MHVGMIVSAMVAALAAGPGQSGELQWFKGNLHTHTWWSDGDSPPETVVAWYKDRGYHFLSLTDHNILSEGMKWINPEKSTKATAATRYEKKYGPGWVENGPQPGKTGGPTFWRARPLTEIRAFFEEPGKFLLIQGEEISDVYEKRPVHLNAFNLRDPIPAQKGGDVPETIQNNVNAVAAQSEKTGILMLAQLNHPNFKWGLTAEDIMPTKGLDLLEIYNGHGGVANLGDDQHPGVEYIWDVVLTRRLAELNLPIIYGTATDDTHAFTTEGPGGSHPGRGWVMVRARYLTPEKILKAMRKGDFYASTGVVLDEVAFKNGTLSIEIQPKPGVTYRTQFIGTLTGYDPKATPRSPDPQAPVTMKYSDDVGKVLAEQPGTKVSYKLTGKEIYVRAKIVSSAGKENPNFEGELEAAWVQPVCPGTKQ